MSIDYLGVFFYFTNDYRNEWKHSKHCVKHFNEYVHFRTDLFDSKDQSDLLTVIVNILVKVSRGSSLAWARALAVGASVNPCALAGVLLPKIFPSPVPLSAISSNKFFSIWQDECPHRHMVSLPLNLHS